MCIFFCYELNRLRYIYLNYKKKQYEDYIDEYTDMDRMDSTFFLNPEMLMHGSWIYFQLAFFM